MAIFQRSFDSAQSFLKAGLSRGQRQYYQDRQKFPRRLRPKCVGELRFLESYQQSRGYPIPAFTLCFVQGVIRCQKQALGHPHRSTLSRERSSHTNAHCAGRSIYKMRKAIVEPVFGQIKERRGFRRFSLRGLENVRHEWKMVCLASNLLKLFGSGWTPQTA